MWRLLLALVILMSAVRSETDLWRTDLRSPETQAYIMRLQQEQAQQQQQKETLQPPPSLQQQQQQQSQPAEYRPSPDLVNMTVNIRTDPIAGSATWGSSASGSSYVDVASSDQIARSVFNFAQNLANQLSVRYRKTEIFSPLSIASSLALLLLGAKGRSYQELSSVFGTSDTIKFHEQFGLMLQDVRQPTMELVSAQRPQVPWRTSSGRQYRRYLRPAPHEVHLANGLFTQAGYTLNAGYSQVIRDIYGSDLETEDFEASPAKARYNINSWVAQHTRNHIESIISSDIPQSTRMILANALYFKAFWETDFLMSATRPDTFYPNGEGTQPALTVSMMATGGSFPYHEDQQLGCKILGLPYRGNLSTMYIIQPFKSSVNQLQMLQQRLNADVVEDLIGKMVRRTAVIAFPKMHITESVNLKTMLQKMGIGGIFSTVQSDLSLIATSEPQLPGSELSNSPRGNGLQSLEAQRRASPAARSDLVVDDIVHKVDFTVNETGTEAAAATVTYLKKSGPDVLFRADTPFIILVRHDPTKLILFYGIINEPPTAN
ncbi:serine protease inhibitor 28Dc [Drosophila guanche]|uniref:Blast:Leukocyte elastase inhibitor n=1 Tax=Drosophila guanche TaxID=7266 RepID=A0A3B0JGQ0_DROGU|nr:serine protease inhibitor 28Dc [Drosophila guanche]SPP79442.1 blast:Leukocyte elastase inhibitor [Drosophila guanche]